MAAVLIKNFIKNTYYRRYNNFSLTGAQVHFGGLFQCNLFVTFQSINLPKIVIFAAFLLPGANENPHLERKVQPFFVYPK